MLKCPFCGFDNEEGALFCEQCKSDLSGVPSTPAGDPAPVPAAAVMEETIPMAAAAEAVPLAEATVPLAAAVVADAAPVAEAPPPPPAAESVPPPPPASAPAAPTSAPEALPAGAQPKFIVIRGQKLNVEYPLYEGHNFIGRSDDKPVDVDLDDQEPPDRVWTSRQHALINFENNTLTVEDLNSANGTFVNRARVYPGSKCPLKVGDIVQIGTVQLKLKV